MVYFFKIRTSSIQIDIILRNNMVVIDINGNTIIGEFHQRWSRITFLALKLPMLRTISANEKNKLVEYRIGKTRNRDPDHFKFL